MYSISAQIQFKLLPLVPSLAATSRINETFQNFRYDGVIINKIYVLKKKNRQDWYDELSDSDKKEIERGLEDLENGNSISHEKVMFSVKQKIEQLKKSS